MSSLLNQDKIIQDVHDINSHSLKVLLTSGLVQVSFNAIVKTNPNPTTELFTYKSGGISGTTVATITIVYTDSGKSDISTVLYTQV